MRTVLWIVGEPGIGKTTAARAFLQSIGSVHDEIANPKWTTFAGGTVAAAGWWRGDAFDGADTLAISQIKPAMAYWRDELECRLAVLDGDKLANTGAVAVAQQAGARLVCVRFVGEALAAKRRALRGTAQNPSWIKGRRTKSERFTQDFPGDWHMVSPSRPSLTRFLRGVSGL